MKIRPFIYLLILAPVLSACVSPHHFVQNKSGTPIPEGSCRITVKRERSFVAGAVPLQIIASNQAMEAAGINVLCYLNEDFYVDGGRYKEMLDKSSEKLVFKKPLYDELTGFPVIQKASTQEDLKQYLPMGYPIMTMGEFSLMCAAAIVFGIDKELSEKEVIVNKEFFETKVCSRLIRGKAIAILGPGDEISWDDTPGSMDLCAVCEVLGSPQVFDTWLRNLETREGYEYIFTINSASLRDFKFKLRQVVEKK